jgi:hypothetical protein
VRSLAAAAEHEQSSSSVAGAPVGVAFTEFVPLPFVHFEARLYKLNAVDPELEKRPGLQLTSLKCETSILVSRFAFKFNVYRYSFNAACAHKVISWF